MICICQKENIHPSFIGKNLLFWDSAELHHCCNLMKSPLIFVRRWRCPWYTTLAKQYIVNYHLGTDTTYTKLNSLNTYPKGWWKKTSVVRHVWFLTWGGERTMTCLCVTSICQRAENEKSLFFDGIETSEWLWEGLYIEKKNEEILCIFHCRFMTIDELWWRLLKIYCRRWLFRLSEIDFNLLELPELMKCPETWWGQPISGHCFFSFK